MLWKCCTQYASKIWKLSSGHRTEKVSFHSNPKERWCQRMFKLCHNRTHLHTSKECSKFSKPGFSNMWTVNFQMFRLVLERQRNQRTNCQHLLHHRKSKRAPEKNIYFCFIDYAKAFDCVDHNKLWKILKEMCIPDHLTYLLRNLYVGQEATVRAGHGTTDWF